MYLVQGILQEKMNANMGFGEVGIAIGKESSTAKKESNLRVSQRRQATNLQC